MKNKIALATAAMVAGSSLATAEIVINDFLSFEGFVDMSYSHTDIDNPPTGEASNANSFQVDQVEISWLFDFDPVTAQVDIEYEDGDGFRDVGGDEDINGDTEVEQAFVTYDLGEGSAITAGRYASMLGFEAFEPTGLYQYSTAYDFFFNNPTGTPGYAQGVKYTYETDGSFFGISLQDEAFENGHDLFGGNGPSSYGVEAAGAFTTEDGLTFFLGGAFEDYETGDQYVINSYVSYETGAWVFAAELNYGENDPDGGASTDGIAGLLMANFAYSDAASVTARVSLFDADNAGADADGYALTLAHGYAFTDNLFMVTEISYAEEDTGAANDIETLFGAVELLFTF
jgi:hypothetical protein